MTIGNYWYVLHREDPTDRWELWAADTHLSKDQAREVERRYRSQKLLVVVGFGQMH